MVGFYSQKTQIFQKNKLISFKNTKPKDQLIELMQDWIYENEMSSWTVKTYKILKALLTTKTSFIQRKGFRCAIREDLLPYFSSGNKFRKLYYI